MSIEKSPEKSAADIVITAARRTAMGAFLGDFRRTTAIELGTAALRAAIADSGLGAGDVGQLFMGCVLPAGLGQAPARQAGIAAGLGHGTPSTTINKVCGSSMESLRLAHDMLKAGSAEIILAGGMESMSNAPYLLPGARAGLRMGHKQFIDHMMRDGLEDAYEQRAMGCYAEETASAWKLSREAQDEFALESLSRSRRAILSGAFAAEITPVATRAGDIATDELPGKARPEKIPHLKPAFVAGGTVTAANSSSIADGAAALALMTRATAEARGLTPLATLLAHSVHAHAPQRFTTAPVGAVSKLLALLGWQAGDVDLYEINEAFACVTMVAIRELGLDAEKVNVNGGATALGHPLGASGARLVVTLLHALQARGGGRGIASLCIGGGEATAVAVQVD